MLHPDSGCFLIFQVNTSERYREGGNISLKKSLLLEEKGKAKGSPSVTEKLQQAFHLHPDARRFWATFPEHGYVEGVCHKDSSGSRIRGMSNPITPITRILLATERSRRRKKREKQSLLLTVKIRQPSHEFTFGVGISFIPYPLVLTPVV
jgi:hypothetical protein